VSEAIPDQAVMTAARPFYHRLPSARKIWLNLHLCIGLTVGLVPAMIGLTGSLLVFSAPMLKLELGHSYFAADGTPVLSPAVDQWIDNGGDIAGVVTIARGEAKPGAIEAALGTMSNDFSANQSNRHGSKLVRLDFMPGEPAAMPPNCRRSFSDPGLRARQND
jgi:hypothetical protein